MKPMKILFASMLLIACTTFVKAQTLNWNNLEENDRHVISANFGVAYGATLGAGYSYHVKSRLPLVLHAAFSMPAGENLFDDFTTRIGAQARLVEWKSFCVSAEASGIFRRYETPYVRLLNFGSEFSGVAGYYRHSWFAAAQVGFDKAIVTHFKNSALLQENYPEIQNGWYQPSTGGNFFYGIQAGCSFNRFDVFAKGGKIIQQDFKTAPFIPFYMEAGLNWKIR